MKDMCPNKKQETNEDSITTEPIELATTQYLVEVVKQLQIENENLKLEIRKSNWLSSGKTGLILLILGAITLALSILNNSQVLAFIGLGLTFWGFLFLFIRPVKYVESTLLTSTAIASYSTIDRIIKDLKYKGQSYYIPPYPKEAYLPEHLKGLKEMIAFISADSGTEMPSVDEIAKSRFLLENPKGICVAPPGLGLLAKFEKELRTDITKLELSELCESLPQLILENLQLAKEVEMHLHENQIYLKVSDSTYKNLYGADQNLKSVHLLGCPLVSAIACAISKNTGKIVTIQKDNVSPDAESIEIWYTIL